MITATGLRGGAKKKTASCCLYDAGNRSRLFLFVRNTQLFPSFSSSVGQDLLTISCRHPLTESVLVLAFPVRWLKCSLHDAFIFGGAKI